MEFTFADRVSGLKPSAIREILKHTQDPSVIPFAAGNPELSKYSDAEIKQMYEAFRDEMVARGMPLAAQITLKEGKGMEATVLDIEVNELNLDIKEMEAAQLPNTRDSAAFAVINGNYALGAGLNVSTDALASEDAASTSATLYANVLVVKEGNEESAKVQALVKALQDEAVKSFIAEKYTGAVVALS